MSGWEKAGDGCTCSVNPNPFTHYGATEPGDALEPDPECPKHFPTRTIEQEAQAEAERRIDENAWLFRRDTEAGWFLNGFIKGAEWGASRPVTDEMVERAISAHRFTNAFGPEEVTRMRAALEAAEGARR